MPQPAVRLPNATRTNQHSPSFVGMIWATLTAALKLESDRRNGLRTTRRAVVFPSKKQAAECDPGWTSSASVRQPQVDYINTLPLGSRAVVCTHSPVMYPLMQAFGIDTSDPVRFPKDTRNRVVGFNNLWVVELKQVTTGGQTTYQGRLLSHTRLDFELGVSLVHRDYGVKAGQGSKSDE